MYTSFNKTVLRERKPPLTPKFQPKVIRDSNPDCWITLDPDVCRISPKFEDWIHYLVGVSHSAQFLKNRALTVREMLIYLLKSPFRNGEENGKVIWNVYLGPEPHRKLVRYSDRNTKFQWNRLITFSVILPTEWHTDGRNNHHITSASLAAIIINVHYF